MGQNASVAGMPGSSAGGLEGFFRLREHGTDVRTEVLAGLTTFFVMAYIIAVNPSILSAAGLDIRAVATSTCLVAGVLSILMGLYTNRAFALAPGLGLNAIVAFNLVGTLGLTPAEAMGVVVAEGILILVLVLLGVRKYVMDVVPASLSRAIAVGIGFFILFIGLRNAGVITFVPGQTGTVDGFLTLTPLNTWPIFVAMVGLLVTIVLMARKVRAAILLGILISTVVAFLVPGEVATMPARALRRPRLLAGRPVQLRLLRQAGAADRGAGRHQLHALRFLRHHGHPHRRRRRSRLPQRRGGAGGLAAAAAGRFARRHRRRSGQRLVGDDLHRIGRRASPRGGAPGSSPS